MTVETITEFLTHDHPPQKEMCGPWLRSGELVMCYAPRGTGKSLFAMSLAYAVATGQPFIGFSPTRAFRTLYLEAEMPQRLTSKRLGQIEAAADASAAPDYFMIWTRDKDGHLPNLGTGEGQAELAKEMRKFELIVIDNLTTAAPPVDSRDDDVKIWYRIKKFLYALRNGDRCVFLVHHAGKSGAQLGTSLRENDMDIIIRLTNPAYQPDNGRTAMYLDFEKARDLEPAQREGLHIEYGLVDGRPVWTYQPAKEHREKEIRRLAGTITNKLILAQMVQCPVWQVHEVLSRNVDSGSTPTGPENFSEWHYTKAEDELF